MKRPDIAQRLQPLVDNFAKQLGVLVEERVEAIFVQVEHAFEAALSAAAGELAPNDVPSAGVFRPTVAVEGGEPYVVPAADALLAMRERAATKHPALKVRADARPDRTAPTSDGKRAPRCSKCGFIGGRSTGCGTSHPTQAREQQTEPAAEPTSDDSEDEPARADDEARAALVELARRRPAPEPAEERVIAHADLVRMLAADREVHSGGDAGGIVLRAERAPSLVSRTEERREFCVVHGWVGRVAFEREQHELCAEDHSGVTCVRCKGRRFSIGGRPCSTCHGVGFMPKLFEVEPANDEQQDTTEADEPAALDCEKPRRIRPKRTRPRAHTTSVKRLTRAVLAAGAEEVDEFGPPVEDVQRPRTREECRDAARPCPWVACKHHLYLDINPQTGSIKINFPDLEPWEMEETCALDIAERGGATLEDVGTLTNLTRERVRQLEVRGLLAMRVNRKLRGAGE